MPLPTAITDLNTSAASNYPAGSDSPSVLDDVQRAHASFIAQLWALVGSASGPLASTAFSSGNLAYSGTLTGGAGVVNIGSGQIYKSAGGVVYIGAASADGTGAQFQVTGGASANFLTVKSSTNPGNGINLSAANAVSIYSNSAARLTLDANGYVVENLQVSAPTLSQNASMAFVMESNTLLRVYVRGNDGATRSAALALA